MFKKILSSIEYLLKKYDGKIKFLNKFFFFTSIKKNNSDIDIKYNKSELNKIGINLEEIFDFLKDYKIDYKDENLSWHYLLFTGLKLKFAKEKKKLNKILEIGTFNGEFTNFLSEIFPETEIFSIDLEKNNNQFLNTYDRDKKDKLSIFFEIRKKNLSKKNIKFYELNSFYLQEKFKDQKFDIIWIDGNHINPQVSFDIFQSLKLVNFQGVICVDDVIIQDEFYKKKYVSNESYKTLEYLSKINIIKNFYIVKRIRKFYKKEKKYISISFINDQKN